MTGNPNARSSQLATGLWSRNVIPKAEKLFAVSCGERKKANDADRLQKYLARFELTWEMIRPA